MTLITTQNLRYETCGGKRKSERRTLFPLPPMQIATDLPCLADKDPEEVPQPKYAPEDITEMQQILLRFVPAELADAIIDMAEYWPYVGVSRNSFASAYSALGAPDENAQWCYLVTPRVPSVERNGVAVPTTVKKVKFMVKTYDSCWGKTSAPAEEFKTWFEASILKNDASDPQVTSYEDGVRPNDWFANLAPHPRYLMEDFRDTTYPGLPVDNPLDSRKRWHVTDNPQSNAKEKSWHEIVWSHDDKLPSQTSNASEAGPETGRGKGVGFIDSLSVDDRIILMTRALSPGWINTIFNVKIEIYYALSSSFL